MYNANSVSISTIVYYYFMHLRTADKTVAPGAEYVSPEYVAMVFLQSMGCEYLELIDV